MFWGCYIGKNTQNQGFPVNTNRTLLAPTVFLRTAGEGVVVGTMDVVVVQGYGFGEDGESGENNEGWEELHGDVVEKGVWGEVVVRGRE